NARPPNSVLAGHLLLALLGEENLNRLAREASPELQKVSVEELHKHFADLTTGTAEDEITSSEAGEAAEPAALGPSKTPSLDQYTIDLTNRARKVKINPVLAGL